MVKFVIQNNDTLRYMEIILPRISVYLNLEFCKNYSIYTFYKDQNVFCFITP